jgi:hypothetical protein
MIAPKRTSHPVESRSGPLRFQAKATIPISNIVPSAK